MGTSDKKATKLSKDSSTCKVLDQLDHLAAGRSLKRNSMVAVSYRKHTWLIDCEIDGQHRSILVKENDVFDLTPAK